MTAQTTYPMTFDVEYPDELSRWRIFVKWLLIIPHWIILYALGLVSGIAIFIAWFAILFARRFPRGLFDFVVNVNRWGLNVGAYLLLMRDEYPPFSWERGRYAVTYEVEYPERLSRWLIFVKWLLVFPHIIVMYLLFLVYGITLLIAWFAILFTKHYPRPLFNFGVGVLRWSSRISVYSNLLRDEYPPFRLTP